MPSPMLLHEHWPKPHPAANKISDLAGLHVNMARKADHGNVPKLRYGGGAHANDQWEAVMKDAGKR